MLSPFACFWLCPQGLGGCLGVLRETGERFISVYSPVSLHPARLQGDHTELVLLKEKE